MSWVRFDPSVVTVKQSFIVSQIVDCPSVLLASVNKSSVRCRLLTTIQWHLFQVNKPTFLVVCIIRNTCGGVPVDLMFRL